MTTRRVIRADVSPMNPRRFCCELECGHEVWVTADRRPRTVECNAFHAEPAVAIPFETDPWHPLTEDPDR